VTRFHNTRLRRLSSSVDGAERELKARFVLDCSGRAGVLARRLGRIDEPGHDTLSLVGVWTTERSWLLPDESHTAIEATDRGWAWSIPVSPRRRHVGFMVDRSAVASAGSGLDHAYRRELEATTHFRRWLEAGRLESRVWSCSAQVYGASRYGRPGFLLVGDAASSVDPLSSFGLKKALGSAWLAAVVVNTALDEASAASDAIDHYDRHERRVYRACLGEAAPFYREAADRIGGRFWEARAAHTQRSDLPVEDDERLLRDERVARALDDLRRQDGRLVRGHQPAIVSGTVVRGRRIVSEPALAVPGLAQGLRFVRGVDLLTVLAAAEVPSSVPELWAACNARQSHAPLPDFIAAAGVLVAHGFLELDSRDAGVLQVGALSR